MINELVTKFSWAGSLKPLKDFNSGLDRAEFGYKKVAAAAVAFAGVFKHINKNAETSVFTRHTETSIEALKGWQYAAEQTGSSAAAAKNTIAGLASQIGKIAVHGSDTWMRYGIRPTNPDGSLLTPEDILQQVRDLFNSARGKNLGINQKRYILSDLGIDPSQVETLSLTNEKYAELVKKRKELQVLTEKEILQYEKVRYNYRDKITLLDGYADKIGLKVLPTINKALAGFSEFAKGAIQVSESFNKAFGGHGVWVAAAASALVFRKSMLAVGLALAPLLIPLAVIGAALLTIDDYMSSIAGRPSILNWNTAHKGFTDTIKNHKSKEQLVKERKADNIAFTKKGTTTDNKINAMSLADKNTRFDKVTKLIAKSQPEWLRSLNAGNSAQYKKLPPEGKGFTIENNITVTATTQEAGRKVGEAVSKGINRAIKSNTAIIGLGDGNSGL